MRSSTKLPLEQRGREEAEKMRTTWNGGPFNFLLTRTSEKYKHKSVAARRLAIEAAHGISLPQVTDEMLLSLYQLACERYMRKCRNRYEYSGFSKTPSEIAFAATLESIIQRNPKLKHLEVYPSRYHSKDLQPNFKMVVGNYVPDFLVFGLKWKRSSAVAIEIDGDSHIDKHAKDELRSQHLKEMKIFPFEVQNDQTLDFDYLNKSILSMYRLRNGSLNDQILRAKRMIWVKTIACQLTLSEIEEFVQQSYSTQLNLRLEGAILVNHPKCPRAVKSELIRSDSAILGNHSSSRSHP